MNGETLSSQDIWNVVHMFFQENTIASPQIESYEAFIDRGMTNVVRESLDVTYEIKPSQKVRDFDYCTVTIHIDEIKAEDKTRQLPNACRLQNTTYCIQLIMKGSMTVKKYKKVTNMYGIDQFEPQEEKFCSIENQELCKLPLLLNSRYCSLHKPNCNEQQIRQHRIFKDECPFDEGGYFIVNGSEKAIVAREANRSNRITVLKGMEEHNELVKATIVSQIAERSMYCKAVVKLVEKKDVVTSEEEYNEGTGKLSKNSGFKTLLKLQLQGEDQPIDLIPVLISLWPGDTLSAAQVLDIIDPSRDPEVIAVARQSYDYAYINGKHRLEAAREYFTSNLKTIVMNATSQNDDQESKAFERYVCTRLLPHVGTQPEDNLAKAAFLGYMAQQCILCHLGKRPFDDRDHWGSKRLQLTGGLMQDLFRRCYQDFQGLLVKELSQRKIYDTGLEFKRQLARCAERSITREFISALATGNWRTGKIGQKVGNQTGVSQNLVRLSYAAAISQIRRTASDIEESSKAVAPRMLHSTQFGYLCPAETPEGGKVGLVKNFTLQCKISVENGAETEKVYQEITQYRTTAKGRIALRRIDQADGRTGVKVFFNGKWLGCVTAPDAIALSDHLKKCRAASQIYYQTSIAYNEVGGELVVATDAGRVLRPLFVIRSGLNRDKSNPAYQLVEYCELACKPAHINRVMNEQFGWTSLIRNKDRLIEYLDPYEEEQTLICSDLQEFKLNQERVQHVQRWARYKREKGASATLHSHNLSTLPLPYTHMEIHPCLILSAISALIPFPDHNQAPRNLFQASMGKQAIGIYALNFQRRFDTQGINVLHSPQRPIGQTRTMRYVKFTDLPAGMNLIVAIAIYTGFNQEDSLIMSQAAVDRGLMRCTYYLSHEAICDPEDVGQDKSGLIQKIMIPSHCRPGVRGQIDKNDLNYLEFDGIPPVGQAITRGRIVIGKVTPCKNMQGEIGTSGRQFQDESVLTKGDEIGYIDSVVLARDKLSHDQVRERGAGKDQSLTTNLSLAKSSIRAASLTAKVRVRQDRPPQLGDKFSSRHGQKGTVGMLYRHEDLPYTWEGVTPDIIVNPHAIPSRMTIGQLLECVGAKVGARLGGSVDCTPFEPPGGIGSGNNDNFNLDEGIAGDGTGLDAQQQRSSIGGVSGVDQESYLTERLFQCGYQRTGYEAMFCGFTGKILNYRIFIGPTFYQRLKHITLDKVSARSTGQVTIKYRQPVEGRSRGGGMRIGEMERDAFLAHGAAAVLRDRTMFSSDVAQYLVCRTCGMIVWHADASLLTTKYPPSCAVCKDEAEFAIIRIPHVCKQLFLEIMAMGVLPRLQVSVE